MPEEKDQINRIREAAIHSVSSAEQIKAIDTLVTYGNKASTITDIIDSNTDDQVRTYGYKAVQKINTYPFF